jgi:hypothetical protein
VRRMLFRARLLGLVLPVMLAGVWPVAAQAAGGLGAAAGFAVLAGTAVTCTDGNVIGPVGLASPSTAVTSTRCNMATQVTGAGPGTGYGDFQTTYNGIKNNLGPCNRTFGAADTLAGLSLAAGTYCFPAAATLTGTLTLTGSGPWFFEIGTGGTGALTATSFTVVGGNPCNAFWWVQQDATATTSALQGTIMAGSITLTDTVLAGRAWANVSVTMTRSNIAGCTAAGGVPVTTKCLSAQQALTEAVAKDVTEDAGEPAPAKTGENDSSDKSKDEGQTEKDSQKSSDADKKEDKAESARMAALQKAVRKACGTDKEGDTSDKEGDSSDKEGDSGGQHGDSSQQGDSGQHGDSGKKGND